MAKNNPKMKIYHDDEMEDLPFPKQQSYKLLINRPSDLADINIGEGSKLSGIDEDANNFILADHDSDELPQGAAHLYDDADATNRAKLGLSATGFVQQVIRGSVLGGTPTTGINITNQYIGYYDGSDWNVYIKSDGKFLFRGDGDNYITWQGSVLNIRGTINADDINAGTLTGRTVRTSAGPARIQMETTGVNANSLTVWDNNNTVGRLYADNFDFNIYNEYISGTITLRIGSSIDLRCQGGYVETKSIFPRVDSFYNLGTDAIRWLNVYADNFPASPLKVAKSGIESFKKIKGIQKKNNKYTLETEDLPEEFKCEDEDGNSHTELKRSLGITMQTVKELIEKVEELENK